MTASRPMRADARRNYERIVAVARQAFTEHGPDAPLDDIARRAGVGAGTLYRHFPQREALMEAVYRSDIETLSMTAYERLDTHAPDEALADWMRELVRFAIHLRGLASALKAALDEHSEVFALCKSMLYDASAAVLTAAQEAGTVRADVQPRDLVLLAHGVAFASEVAPDAADRILAVTLDGLRTAPATAPSPPPQNAGGGDAG
jgi:AcrR family transcriptional regulator